MKNQDRKHLFPVLENSATVPASINRNSPSKGAIKAVLPPALPKRIINDALLSPCRDESVDYINDPNIYYDGNNYYNSHTSMSSTIHPIVPSDPENFNQNRYSSVSFDSSKSGCELAKSHSTTSNRASMQSYESLTSTSSNKDSENSQQSSISSSNSSSFCSSSSCSSFSFPNTLSTHTQSPSSINIDNFNLSNNIFLKTKQNKSNMRNYLSNSELKDDLIAQVGPLTIPEMLLHGVADSEMIHIWLQKINMIKYENNFIDNAYDMATIARMDAQDLMAIGITDPKARSLFRAEIQKLKIPENLPTYKPCSLLEWLKLLNLDCYYNGLCQQGYSTIDRVTELTWEDLEEVGIAKLGHQKKILLAIKKIKSIKIDSEKSCTGALQSIQDVKPVNIISNANIYEPLSVETYTKPSNNNEPYQDVMIKMYANQNINSPNHLDMNQIEICHKDKRNLIRSPSFDTKAPLFTFQQNVGKKSPTMLDLANNTPMDQMNYLRRRSFESLNTNEINNCSSFSNNPNYCKSTYQYSNCDLSNSIPNNNNNSFNRQTICFQNNLSLNTFMNNNHKHEYNLDYNYEPPPVGTTTLNRPKILKKNKYVPNHVPNFRPENTITNLIKPSEIKLNSSTSDVYTTFKKKPPPPPRRFNSILESNSMPTTPRHNFDRTHSLENTNYVNYSNDLRQSSIRSDTLFASCIKNLTNNYLTPPPMLQSSLTNVDNASKIFSNKSSRTFPINNNNSQNAFKDHFNEQLNASSSSSGESMYFAHDNVGTIRQKPSNISQQNTCQKFDFNRPSSTSSADEVFKPFTNYVDNQSQNIVDSLEHIEMMLATLKTQLESID